MKKTQAISLCVKARDMVIDFWRQNWPLVLVALLGPLNAPLSRSLWLTVAFTAGSLVCLKCFHLERKMWMYILSFILFIVSYYLVSVLEIYDFTKNDWKILLHTPNLSLSTSIFCMCSLALTHMKGKEIARIGITVFFLSYLYETPLLIIYLFLECNFMRIYLAIGCLHIVLLGSIAFFQRPLALFWRGHMSTPE